MPMLFITLGVTLAWFANTGTRFSDAAIRYAVDTGSASFAMLGLLSVLRFLCFPDEIERAAFAVMWMALAVAGLFGVPVEWLTGTAASSAPDLRRVPGARLVRARAFGRVLQMPPLSRMFAGFRAQDTEASSAPSRFRGWPVLVMQ